MRFIWPALAAALLPGVPVWAQGIWETRANYPLEATEVSAATIDGKIYALCGLVRAGSVNSLFIYDPYTDAWRQGASIPIPGGADHCNVAAAGGKLYLVGGLGGLGNGDTYEYDPTSDAWTRLGRMPTPRGASGVAAIGNRIYVAGGLAGGRSVAAFEVYDRVRREWTQLPDMLTARDHLTAQAVNGKFYALSGRVGNVLSANEEYDPAENTWRRRTPLPTPRGGLGSGAIGGRIQVFGGEGPSGTPQGTYRHNEEYDPATDTWRSLPPMPTPRHGLYGATLEIGVGGCVFAPSGGPIAGANYSSVHEVFCLPAAQPPEIQPGGARHAASFLPALSPGTLVALFGRRLAPFSQAANRFPLPTQMGGVVVKANGRPVPLLFVSPTQINLLLPHDLAASPISLTVTHAGVEGAALTLPDVADPTPGLFALTQSGQGQGAILIAGTGLIAGVSGPGSRPARPGEILEIYGTGLGPVGPVVPAPGQPAPSSPLAVTLQTPMVTVGRFQAEVLFSGLAPGLAGVYQVNARVPSGLTADTATPVALRMGAGGVSSNTVTVAIGEVP